MKPPKLDDRSWRALRDSMVRLIPAHAPEWTDHNPSDPGIALIELFSHLGMGLVSRINDVPNAAEPAFLRLLQLTPDSARPGRGWVTFETADPAGVTIPYGPTVGRTYVAAGNIEYQLEHELDVHAVELRSFIKAPEDFTFAASDIERVRQALTDALGTTVTGDLETYRTVELPPIENGEAPPGIPLAASVDQTLWIAIAAQKSDDLSIVRDGLESGRIWLTVGVDDVGCGIDGAMECAPRERRHDTQWQISTGEFAGPEHPSNARWRRLELADDGTSELRRTGVVQLALPAALDRWHFDDEDGATGGVPAEFRGVGGLPPSVEDSDFEERIIAWVRVFRTSAEHPVVRWTVPNAASIRQAVTVEREPLGVGSGVPYQSFSFARTGVLPETVDLQIRLDGERWVSCERVEDLIASGPQDLHFTLDPAAGIARFGDGRHGRMPQPGEHLRVFTYQVSVGAAGNVGAGRVSRVSRGPTRVEAKAKNLLPIAQGADATTLLDLRERAPSALRNRDRCVAAEDFRDIALRTPEVRVGRAEVLARFKPFERAFEVPGAVTVVVLPDFDPEHPDEPTPDADFLSAVCAWLDPRRLVTTELYVTGPEYVPLWASIAIEVEEGFGELTIQNWVALAIRQFLAPLPPYGPAGGGWPLGRAVRREDLAASALKVSGVRLVEQVRLWSADGEVDELPLARWELPSVRELRAFAGTEAPDVTIEPVDPPGERLLIPVHVREC